MGSKSLAFTVLLLTDFCRRGLSWATGVKLSLLSTEDAVALDDAARWWLSVADSLVTLMIAAAVCQAIQWMDKCTDVFRNIQTVHLEGICQGKVTCMASVAKCVVVGIGTGILSCFDALSGCLLETVPRHVTSMVRLGTNCVLVANGTREAAVLHVRSLRVLREVNFPMEVQFVETNCRCILGCSTDGRIAVLNPDTETLAHCMLYPEDWQVSNIRLGGPHVWLFCRNGAVYRRLLDDRALEWETVELPDEDVDENHDGVIMPNGVLATLMGNDDSISIQMAATTPTMQVKVSNVEAMTSAGTKLLLVSRRTGSLFLRELPIGGRMFKTYERAQAAIDVAEDVSGRLRLALLSNSVTVPEYDSDE